MGKVRVWARIRPTADFAHEVLQLSPDKKTIDIHLKRDPKKGFVNNQILDWSFKLDGYFHNANQEQVYTTVAADIVQSALHGYNGTLLCYGQTGAGKTFTMAGATEIYENRGLIPRALSQLYKKIGEKPDHAITVRISYLEIYNDTMFDLLSTLPESWDQMTGEPLSVSENENVVFVKGLTCHVAQNEEDALNFLFEGETNRVIGEHTLNKMSTRSHCIFTVYIETRSRVHTNAKYTISKLNFVDLAGSERIGKTNSEGQTQVEAKCINKSLTFLEQVVISLTDKKREHFPFRQCKLTHFLKDSIGWKCKTLLIANIWGEASQIEETISTLRFAIRMMCVPICPAVNEEYDPVLLVKELQKQISHLRKELAMHDTLTNRMQINYDRLTDQQKYDIKQQVCHYLEGTLENLDIVNLHQIWGTFEAFKEVYLDMAKDIEERLKEKYTFIDKTDVAAIAAAQKVGIPITDNGIYVGDTDGQGFGVGLASKSSRSSPSSIVQSRKKERERERKKIGKGRQSPAIGKETSASSLMSCKDHKTPSIQCISDLKVKISEDKEEEMVPLTAVNSVSDNIFHEKPSTPPPRSVAFEEFKQEKGSEIQRILVENKEILALKKKNYAELARHINQAKLDIDRSRLKLESFKHERKINGQMYSEEGDVIISEEEFLEIKQLKEYKKQYRSTLDDLKQCRTETDYCQKLVNQCRQRLIQEFDQWFAVSYLMQEQQQNLVTDSAVRAGLQQLKHEGTELLEDEQEKFHRLQRELLMSDPNSIAYYSAHTRTLQREDCTHLYLTWRRFKQKIILYYYFTTKAENSESTVIWQPVSSWDVVRLMFTNLRLWTKKSTHHILTVTKEFLQEFSTRSNYMSAEF